MIKAVVIAGVGSVILLVIGVWVGNRGGTGSRGPTDVPKAPPLSSLIRFDPAARTWHLEQKDLSYRYASGSFADVAVGEGAVWVSGSFQINRIDPASGESLATIASGNSPVEVGYHSVWTADSRIDVGTNELYGTVPSLRQGQTYTVDGLAVGAGSAWTTTQDGSIVRREPHGGRIDDEIHVGSGATAIAAGEEGLWVIDSFSSEVYRLDTQTDRAVWHGELQGNLTSICVGEGSAWVLDGDAGQVIPIDASTNEIGSPIRVGRDPWSITVGLGAVWIADQGDGDLWRIDPLTEKATRFSIGAPMLAVAADESNHVLWIAVGKTS